MNYLKKLLCYSLILLSVACHAQDKPATLLWKVTKPGSTYESYLFGTFHEVHPNFFDSLTNVVKPFRDADVLFVESSNTNLKEEKNIDKKVAWNKKDWWALLTKSQQQIFEDFVRRAEDTTYFGLNPLYLMLATARLYFINFCDSNAFFTDLMDTHIEKLAVLQNKKVVSLDIDQIDDINNAVTSLKGKKDSTYAVMIVKYMKAMLEEDLTGCAFINAYKSFDLNYEFNLDLSLQPDDYILLINRNQQWVEKLKEAFVTKQCFVAVGFRHLFYKQGLIQQLRQLGFNVTPVPMMNNGV